MSESFRSRKSLRLQGYDYTQAGAYFITLCTRSRERLFGRIVDGEMRLNEWGLIVRDEWIRSGILRSEMVLDEFVVMPDHFHGIAIIQNPVGVDGCPPNDDVIGGMDDQTMGMGGISPGVDTRPPLRERRRLPKSLGSLIAGFKSMVTARINTIRESPGTPVWQREYNDHIIRNDGELHRIRRYIRDNPRAWGKDPRNRGASG